MARLDAMDKANIALQAQLQRQATPAGQDWTRDPKVDPYRHEPDLALDANVVKSKRSEDLQCTKEQTDVYTWKVEKWQEDCIANHWVHPAQANGSWVRTRTSNAYTHACMHTYILKYINTCIHTYGGVCAGHVEYDRAAP